MFAYVKYSAKCSRHEEKNIVPVSKIRHFDSKNLWNRKKSYNVKCGDSYCTAVIIFVEETVKKLNDKIASKRQVLPPKGFIEPASDITASDCDVNVASSAKQVAKNASAARVKNLLDQKLEALSNKGAPRENTSDRTARKINDENIIDKITDKVLQDTTNTEKDRVVDKRNYPSDARRREEKGSVSSSSSKHDKHVVGSAAKKVESDSRECNNAKHQKLMEEIRDLKKKCSLNENKIAEQDVMIKEVATLNIELQRDVIQYFDEFKAMAKQYEGAIRNLEGADTPPVGYIRKSNNTIHLGRHIWIPKSTYDAAVIGAKTNALFVKNMAVAVFGHNVLQTSSVTGTQCNKYKDRATKPKLDETKILAIQDIFRYWLTNVKKCSEYEAQLHASKTQLHISRKISDMNRSAGKRQATLSTTDEANQDTDGEAEAPEKVDGEAEAPEKVDGVADESEKDDDELAAVTVDCLISDEEGEVRESSHNIDINSSENSRE